MNREPWHMRIDNWINDSIDTNPGAWFVLSVIVIVAIIVTLNWSI